MTNTDNLDKLYRGDPNFRVINISDKKICYIFCSSNGLWANVENFCDFESLKDRYEWINLSKNKRLIKKSGKYIFVRDVFQKSYVDGVNPNINSIDKIIDLLKRETLDYDVITVGTSGGGYLAMILGAMLPNCIRVYSFGGLFSLHSWTGANNNFSFENIDAYQKHINDYNYSKYFSIKELVNSFNKLLLHFYGAYHFSDCVQLDEIKDISNSNIKLIGIKTGRHGGEFYGFSYPYLLTMSESRINKICRKSNQVISKNRFAIKSMGLFSFTRHLLKKIIVKK